MSYKGLSQYATVRRTWPKISKAAKNTRGILRAPRIIAPNQKSSCVEYIQRYYSENGFYLDDWELIPKCFQGHKFSMWPNCFCKNIEDRDDASSKELDERGEAFKFILARVCAAMKSILS